MINLRFLTIASFLVLLLAGCGGGDSDQADNTNTQASGTGSLAMSLSWPSDDSDAAQVSQILAVSNTSLVPAGVTTIRVVLSATGQSTITTDFAVADGSGIIRSVPVGTWTATVKGLDGSSTTLYTGSVTGVTVTESQTYNCGTVTMADVRDSNDIDDDGDGYTESAGDCDDSNANISPNTIWYHDNDGDGYSTGATLGPQCSRPTTRYFYKDELTAITGDCDDSDSTIYPGATDIPNDGIDQDCSGSDETLASGNVYSAGQIWLDKNLGASQVATSYNDSAAYGDLYQWGRGTDGHEKRTSSTTTTLSSSDNPGHGSFITNSSSPYDWRSPQNDNLWQGVNGTNNPCPAGFRLPTETELETERASWSSNDRDGAFASPLKLVSAGGRYRNNGSVYAGSSGHYWSSTVSGSNARALYFLSGSAYMFIYNRADGFSVRCLED
ncbi:MAG: hypothetical protein KKB30_13140 [Proteobacteria bacterium]|nr:hypothetical protein [Pseudomonadota bacterium]MBU1716820.1 hypothetical protein [Pseudomonadota bacterium]